MTCKFSCFLPANAEFDSTHSVVKFSKIQFSADNFLEMKIAVFDWKATEK